MPADNKYQSEIDEDPDDFDSFFGSIYPGLDAADEDHQFLTEHALKLDADMKQDKRGNLVIPLFSSALKITAFLFISRKGVFRFLGSKKSRFAFLNRKSRKRGQPIFITRDLASAKSITEATNAKAIATLTSEPLSNFAESIQMIFPDAPIVIASDVTEKDQVMNASVQTNLRSYGVIYPHFDASRYGVGAARNNFNDLKRESGIMEVRRQIRMKLARLTELQESRDIRSR